jgi:hypothetical protein
MVLTDVVDERRDQIYDQNLQKYEKSTAGYMDAHR